MSPLSQEVEILLVKNVIYQGYEVSQVGLEISG